MDLEREESPMIRARQRRVAIAAEAYRGDPFAWRRIPARHLAAPDIPEQQITRFGRQERELG